MTKEKNIYMQNNTMFSIERYRNRRPWFTTTLYANALFSYTMEQTLNTDTGLHQAKVMLDTHPAAAFQRLDKATLKPIKSAKS